MRASTFALVAGLATSAIGVSTASANPYDTAVETTPGLLGYYTFTPAAQADSVVDGYTGVLENGASVAAGAGPTINGAPVSALVLDNGVDGTAYATAGGANPLLGGISSSGSIVAWIDLASLPSTYGRIYSIAGESQVGDDFDFQINPDNQLALYTEGGANVSTQLTSADVGTWIQVVATFTNGADRSLYIDGVLAATNTPGYHGANSAPFYVGQSNVFGDRYFDGSISDVAVFDTDLTSTQVASLYATASVPAGSGGAVPEPSSWALMLIGVGAAGGMMRRRAAASAWITSRA